ncbi:hypothetical protein CC2G_000935 [Coprinopsis cinerea AmutBmut pab1-1]|nr:hypothetical protein CC2G_000935 [Coprinopsis cinerea AmutBmut pab1-1]
MDNDWDPRHQMNYNRQDWQEHGAINQLSTSASPPHPSYSTQASLSQRRRSSAAHGRPAVPPPNLPIPSIPSSPPSRPALAAHPAALEVAEDGGLQSTHISGRPVYSNTYTRPTPSPSLSAVAAFSQSRQGAPGPSHPQLPTTSPHDDLSDPPPQSFLPSTSENPSSPTSSSRRKERETPSEDLLQPRAAERSDRKSEHKPSSRRALTRALELAREAVLLDSTNDNPEAAVNAYAQSVALLSEVMERVRRGEDSTDTRRRRRRSVAAQEDEIRRLQNIHDTYADRMNILSIIYSIPAVPYTSTSVYSADSTNSNSPTTSASPTSDSSPQIPVPNGAHFSSDEPEHDTNGDVANTQDGGSIYLLDEQVLSRNGNPQFNSVSQHPYAAYYDGSQAPQPPAPQPSQPRSSTMLRRSRASSNLPPPPPPPSDSLPPAPVVIEPRQEVGTLPHLPSAGKRPGPIEVNKARRTSNSHLVALKEEGDDNGTYEIQFRERSSSLIDPARHPKRESPPLPPLPSPPPASGSAPTTPRTNSFSKAPSSPRLAAATSRPRGTSQLTTRSEFASQSQGYPGTSNHSQGVTAQRRPKTSAPPSTRSASPADSTISTGSMQQARASAFPGAPPPPITTGRSRSSSQPGRRPSIAGRSSPPPLPTNGIPSNGSVMRKASFPTKLVPTLPSLSLDSTTNSSYLGSVMSPHLPTTPTSPLPPLPPTDPLLKPYHMMGLLRNTITSSTGGYITRRLHVPCEVWSQGGAKLSNVVEKVRVVAILCSALEDLQNCSADYFGAGNVNNGMALGIGSIGRKEAEGWLSKLDDFSNICDGVVANFGKKLGVGEGFVLKKTTWGDKLTRRFDKFTNGKNLDSPAAYVQGLKKLFAHSQLLDEHTRALLSHPLAPSYAAFPNDVRTLVEQRLKRSSEFFATVVLTFVIRDLSQLLDKYVKKCEKWLAE